MLFENFNFTFKLLLLLFFFLKPHLKKCCNYQIIQKEFQGILYMEKISLPKMYLIQVHFKVLIDAIIWEFISSQFVEGFGQISVFLLQCKLIFHYLKQLEILHQYFLKFLCLKSKILFENISNFLCFALNYSIQYLIAFSKANYKYS